MPESPEVQALAEFLDERTAGRVVAEVDILEFRAVKTRARPPSTVVGARVGGVRRFGKHLDLTVGDAHLGISLGRHGWVRFVAPGSAPVDDPDAPPALASFTLDDGATIELTDAGTWVSVGLSVVDEPQDVAALGPDPADDGFGRADVDAVVTGRRKQLKAVLQEQESIAGIGNAYSDEILFVARLSPTRKAAELDEDERARLSAAVTSVIRDAIAARRGVPIDRLKEAKIDAMLVHGRAGEPCPGCGGVIEDFAFGGTSAQWCPSCQSGERRAAPAS